MKKLFFIAGFTVVELMLHIGIVFARTSAKDAQNILNRIKREESKSDNGWKSTGPTAEDIRAANQVKNLAAKGSQEEKLINSAKNGDLKNVKTLIAEGAGLEARDNKDMTALMWAAEKGYSDIVRLLIDAGADISAKDKFGCTAFFKAADKNYVEVVKMLITEGAAADESFEDMFVRAVYLGNIEMVKAFMAATEIKSDILEKAYRVVLYDGSEVSNIIEKALNKEF